MDEELRQREREREREREKEREREADREREREREREKELEREREKERERERERERELERQRDRAREKELSMVKAMEGPFLPVSELHGLRSHPAEERVKPAEQLTPGRPGTSPCATVAWLQWQVTHAEGAVAGGRDPALPPYAFCQLCGSSSYSPAGPCIAPGPTQDSAEDRRQLCPSTARSVLPQQMQLPGLLLQLGRSRGWPGSPRKL